MGALVHDRPDPPVLFSHHTSLRLIPLPFNSVKLPPKTIILLVLKSSTAELEYLGKGPELDHCCALRAGEDVISKEQIETAMLGIVNRLCIELPFCNWGWDTHPV